MEDQVLMGMAAFAFVTITGILLYALFTWGTRT